MKFRNLVFFFASVVTLGAWAAVVSERDVKAAAAGWLQMRSSALGVDLGRAVGSSALLTTTNGAAFYQMKTASGATVFMNSDDRLEPVMGFTDEDVGEIDPKSPLWALLNDHVSIANAALLRDQSAGSERASANATKWAALIRKGNLDLAGAIQTEGGISDMRVNALVAAKWDQTVVGGQACYNYYTPNGSNAENFISGHSANAPCGCVATAMSQLMWYHRYPYENTSIEKRYVTWTAADGTQTSLHLAMMVGVYDWANMPAEPQNIDADVAKKIGMLTYNAGLAVNMQYSDNGSGAYTYESGEALKEQFGYSSAYCAMISGAVAAGGESRRDALGRVMFANFNAGLPVLVSIPGHAVVADGYGFVDTVDYVHFNMGWSGQRNFWYNIPDLTAAGSAFTAINCVIYNIYTQDDDSRAVLSGRVVDDEYDPCANANVAIYDEAGNLAKELVASQYGVWGAVLPSGRYRVRATTADGVLAGESELNAISTPGAAWDTIPGGNRQFRRVNGNYGNVWDVEVQVSNPSVALYHNGTLIDNFSRFDRAIREVENREGEDGFEIAVFEPARMVAPVTVTKKIAVRIEGETSVNKINVLPTAIGTTGTRNWFIQVAPGAELSLTGVVFDLGGETGGVDVQANGVLKVAGELAIGDRIWLDWDEGLVLTGELTQSLTIDCPLSSALGERFGRVEAAGDLSASALKLCNAADGELFGGIEGTRLVWSIGEVPADAAAARLEQGGDAVNFTSLRHLFASITNDARVVLLKTCTLESEVAVSNRLELTAENAAARLEVARNAAFLLGDGGDMRLSAVAIGPAAGSGFAQEQALFTLTSSNSVLSLGDAASIEKINATGKGVIVVKQGRFTMADGAKIADCSCSEDGGAVWLQGSGAEFNMAGGEISGCTAGGIGGGVYVANGAAVVVAGSAKVMDNVSQKLQDQYGAIYGRCNLYLAATKAANPPALAVDGALSGYVGVYYSGRNRAGAKFAVPVGEAAEDETTLLALKCDWLDSEEPVPLTAAYDSGSGVYVWRQADTGPQPVNPEAAHVRIEFADGTYHYSTFEDALAVATNNAVITILRDTEWTADSTLSVDLTLNGENGAVLKRAQAVTMTVPEGLVLTITNLTVDGSAASATGAMAFHANGGAIVLEAGAKLLNLTGAANRASGAIVAERGAIVTMKSGAAIRNCANEYVNEAEGTGCGGAILADNATVQLLGGEISGCRASRGGGIYLGNGSCVYIGGDIRVEGNLDLSATPQASDIVAQNSTSRVYYSAPLSGTVGYREGAGMTETNVFGAVQSSTRSTDWSALAEGATNFFNDVTLSRGVLATNSTGSAAVLVWAKALDQNAQIAVAGEDGLSETYTAASAIPADYNPGSSAPEPVYCVPFTFTAIERQSDGTWRLKLAPGVKYCIYTLYTGDNLVDWTQVGEAQVLSADGEFEFSGNGEDAARFWKVTGEDGVKPIGE